MTIIISTSNSVTTLSLGAITLTIDIKELPNTYLEVLSFVKLFKEDLDLDEAPIFKELFIEYIDLFTFSNSSITIEYNPDTGKLSMKDINIEDSSIDLLKLITFFKTLEDKLTSSQEPQEEELQEEELLPRTVEDFLHYFNERTNGKYIKTIKSIERALRCQSLFNWHEDLTPEYLLSKEQLEFLLEDNKRFFI